jgi:hypothetical protein
LFALSEVSEDMVLSAEWLSARQIIFFASHRFVVCNSTLIDESTYEKDQTSSRERRAWPSRIARDHLARVAGAGGAGRAGAKASFKGVA